MASASRAEGCGFESRLRYQIAYLGREPTIEDMDSLRANLYGSRHAEDLLGRQVVEKVVDLDDFAQRWRRHFVVSMKPGFLPKEWKIDKKAYSAPVVQ